MQDFQEKIKQNTKYILLQKLIIPIINMLITIYIVRKLTIIDYGLYNLLYALIGYLTLFSSMGLLNVFQRFIPEYYAKKEYSKVKILFKYGVLIRFMLALIFIIILLIFGNFLNHLFKIDNFNEYIKFFFIGIILFLEVQVVEVTLSSLWHNKSIMISYLITTIFRAIITYFFLEKNAGLKELLLAETLYYAFLLIIQLFFYYFSFCLKHYSHDKTVSIKRLLRYSCFSYLDEIGWTILDVKTDFFIISSFLGPTMVGLYAFANQFIESISKVMPFKIMRSLIRTVFFSKFSENYGIHQIIQKFNMLIKFIAFISFPIFLGIIVYGDKIIIHLFDSKYLPGLPILWIFTGFMMIISLQFPLQLVVQAVEKVEITFYSKIFSIYNLIGDLLVVQLFGILGVALVTCSARLFQFIFIFWRIRKFVPLTIDLQPLVKIFVNSLIMMAVLYLVKNLVNNSITLVVCLALGLITYLSSSFINKSFFVEEREIINNLLPRPIFVF